MITVIFLFGPYPSANIEVRKQGPSSLPLIGAQLHILTTLISASI